MKTYFNIADLPIGEDKKHQLDEAIAKRGYNTIWHHTPTFTDEPDESKYKFKCEIIRWNTKSERVIKMGVRFCDKKKKCILSYYRQGSTPRIKHGQKLR